MLKLPLLDQLDSVGATPHKLQLYRRILSDLLQTSCFVWSGPSVATFPLASGHWTGPASLHTLPKTNIAPEKVFQPSISRCYVSFRKGNIYCLQAFHSHLQRIQIGKTQANTNCECPLAKRNILLKMNQILGIHDKFPSKKDHFDKVVGCSLQQILFLACKQIVGSWKTTWFSLDLCGEKGQFFTAVYHGISMRFLWKF